MIIKWFWSPLNRFWVYYKSWWWSLLCYHLLFAKTIHFAICFCIATSISFTGFKKINKHFYSCKMDDTSRIILFKYLIKSFARSVKKFSLGSIENAQFGKRLKTAISGVLLLKTRTFCSVYFGAHFIHLLLLSDFYRSD